MAEIVGEATTRSLLAKVNQLVQLAAAKSDYGEVQRLARIAEGLSALEKREEQIAQTRANLAALIANPNPVEKTRDSEDESARERGNRVRRHFVEGVLPRDDIYLNKLGSKKYRTANGRKVGITYAKELHIRPSFWFAGLSDESFDFVILLCESSDETGAEIAALVFPPDFVRQIWSRLSRSKGQVKFHVGRTGYMNFELRLPGSEPINVSQYLNAVNALKKLRS